MTLWKSDWESSAWKLATSNPYRSVKSLPGLEESVASMWGKSFKKGKSVATPSEALSLQLHCLVKDAKIGQFLAKSGFNLLWATPKLESGRPHDAWRLNNSMLSTKEWMLVPGW